MFTYLIIGFLLCFLIIVLATAKYGSYSNAIMASINSSITLKEIEEGEEEEEDLYAFLYPTLPILVILLWPLVLIYIIYIVLIK